MNCAHTFMPTQGLVSAEAGKTLVAGAAFSLLVAALNTGEVGQWVRDLALLAILRA
jgi:hypothetical protein